MFPSHLIGTNYLTYRNLCLLFLYLLFYSWSLYVNIQNNQMHLNLHIEHLKRNISVREILLKMTVAEVSVNSLGTQHILGIMAVSNYSPIWAAAPRVYIICKLNFQLQSVQFLSHICKLFIQTDCNLKKMIFIVLVFFSILSLKNRLFSGHLNKTMTNYQYFPPSDTMTWRKC